MKEISLKKLKKIPKHKIISTNYGSDNKRLLVKGKKNWKEQEDKRSKEFKISLPLNKTASELVGVRKNSLHKYKIAMAYLSSRIIVNPNMTDYQETLLGFLIEKCPLVSMTVRKFAAVTIMEIFHEILPDYKIISRDKVTDLKEEVKEAYKREESILKFYMKYLKSVLENLDEAKKNKKELGFQSLETTMVGCLGNLFLKHPKFNYCKDLLKAITPYLNSPQVATRKQVSDTFVQLLNKDQTGEVSFMIVKSIYTVIMKMKLKIHQDVVKVLFHLRLEHLHNIDKIKFEKKISKRDLSHKQLLFKKMQRKKGHSHYSRKERLEHKKELYKRENKWLEDKDELIKEQEKNNSEVLQLTLGIYFLILKKKPKPLVISAVFEGLARYAHLINIEFFCDLLKVMDEFFASYCLGTQDQLYCIQTVFTILHAQHESLAIDPYRFYIHLYNVLTNITTENSLENIVIVVGILDLLFMNKKTNIVSVPRSLALIKRFSSISCNMPTYTDTLLIMSTVSKHFIANTFNEILLDTDQQGCPGRFIMCNKEPDTANAGATALFELYFNQRYYHPHVKQLSEAMITTDIYKNQNSLTKRLVMRSCKDLNHDYNFKRGVLNPGVPCPEEQVKFAKKHKTNDDLPFANIELYETCMNEITDDKIDVPPAKKQKLNNGKLSKLNGFNLINILSNRTSDLSQLKNGINLSPGLGIKIQDEEMVDNSCFLLGVSQV